MIQSIKYLWDWFYSQIIQPDPYEEHTTAPAVKTPTPERIKTPVKPKTMDSVTLQRIDTLHPARRPEAHLIYGEICDALTGRSFCRIAQAFRSFEEQSKYYAQGRTTPGKIVTYARSGYSFHNYGLAVDIVLVIDGKEASWDELKDFDADGVADWMECVRIFKAHGWEWGGDWAGKKRDAPHFQKTGGASVDTLLKQYSLKQFIPNTKYLSSIK